jgi:hypothetical protein
MTLFVYSFYSKKLQFESERVEKFKTKLVDTTLYFNNRLVEANYFTLRGNDNAQNYLENYSIEKLISKIEHEIMEKNDNPEGNILVEYGKINDKKFIINKIQVINHRWIIADFSNGDLWGEVLLQYFIEEDESITFSILKSTLYTK